MYLKYAAGMSQVCHCFTCRPAAVQKISVRDCTPYKSIIFIRDKIYSKTKYVTISKAKWQTSNFEEPTYGNFIFVLKYVINKTTDISVLQDLGKVKKLPFSFCCVVNCSKIM